MEAFFISYQNYIYLTFAFVIVFFIGKIGSVKLFVDGIYETIVSVIKFFAKSLSEEDGNGGKPSFSRILGVYATVEIVAMSWVVLNDKSKFVPDVMMTIFWVTIGYAMISKVISTASPLLQDVIRAYLLKIQNTVPTNKPDIQDAPKP